MQPTGRRLVTQLEVDDDGLLVQGEGDFPVDVRFDGHRLLSFWLQRDTEARGPGRFYAWPTALRPYLNGSVRVSLVDPADDAAWVETDAVFGDGAGTVSVVDKDGNRLAFDKSGRLTRLFGDADASAMVPVLDAMDTVIAALEKAGIEPFIAYGTLLGAVRNRDFIGHDSDADLGYVSRYDNPAEVALESFRIQRRLQEMGYAVERYSGLGFKVIVQEGEGRTRGLDVFGGFMRAGKLYLMGEVGVPFEEAWLRPRGTARLADRDYPVPAVPERLLEAMYGAGWRVPDPAFRFTTPDATVRRLNGWFRGMRAGYQQRWNDQRERTAPPDRTGPSAFVRWVRDREPEIRLAVDIGSGTGADALWLARQGVPAVGLDYFPQFLRVAMRRARTAERRGLTDPPTYGWVNLLDLRSVMVVGAQLARRPGPRVILARHVLDDTTRVGRENLVRMAKMLSRRGGHLYLQVQTAATPRSATYRLHPLAPDTVRRLVEASGGRVLETMMLSESEDGPADAREGSTEPSLCRMVVAW